MRLPPAEWFPAGDPDIRIRRVSLRDGLQLRVLEAGPANGPPVVLLHGWAVSAYLWRHNIKPLAAAGYRVHAPDLPGHGLSAAPKARGHMTLDRLTASLAMLLDALDVDRAPIVAQSMGARIAIELARCEGARVSRLALFGPVGFGLLPPHKALVSFLPSLPGTLPSLVVTRRVVEFIQRRVHGKPKMGWFTERDVDEYWAPSQFPGIVRAQLQILREFDWAPLQPVVLAALPIPTLVVFGTLDRTVRPANVERLVAALPAGRLEWIVGGGHVVMEEVPDRVNTMLLAFLGEMAAAPNPR
ncbi:MAG TPA: alpha/beta fold hydrolase [Gemmatimonadaceae bacterium]|nr:alpha/beta fold hydrolase [Gemmatimonadaceae bacterium]